MDIAEYLLDKYGVTMTTAAAGEILHRHPSHIRALCQESKLPAVRIGDRWHFITIKFAAMLEGVQDVS